MIHFDVADLRTSVVRRPPPENPHGDNVPWVHITHIPTGTAVTCGETNSVLANHRLARAELENLLANQMGEPDATSVAARDLLRLWYQWWTDNNITMPGDLHVRTAAFLAATAIQDGRKIRSPREL